MLAGVCKQSTFVMEWNSARTDTMKMNVVRIRGNPTVDIIRIHYECEGEIEKSIPRITDWHQDALMMIKGDHEEQIFLSHPHTNNGFSFLLTTKYHILYCQNMKMLLENPKFAEMRQGAIILTLQ